ncbi:MAG: CapA family protein [Bacteroides sp.]|nr:CapA family protein [Bacteroides sp.]
MKILFWGDIMPGGILPYTNTDPLSPNIKNCIGEADLVIGTLECAIGDGLPYDPVKMKGRANIIYAPVCSSDLLTRMRFNIMSLANNHIFDLGMDGLRSTIDVLNRHQISHTGAGENIEEALRPVIIDKEGIRIAFIAGCTYDPSQVAYVPVATKDHYGIAPLEGPEILHQIKKCKDTCDFVIILAHWGKEYSTFPLKSTKRLSEDLIEAGADLIIGTHTHMVQPKAFIKRKQVFFSLGNGLFPDFLMTPPRPIWYPKSTEISIGAFPVTKEYPYPVEETILRKWPKSSRTGMIVITSVYKEHMVSSERFIELSDENTISIVDAFCLKSKLRVIGLFLQTAIYDEGLLIRKGRNLLSRIKRKLIN